ncbi:hypothetical protein Y032_0457g1799 [Ancylostoma ceylanicum]|uniref:SCP domain-containing protein n=1 Tax=Ancylostoma ceylanicum TaxID=53326 RepID=A0A016WZ94_9BILA|nr:hypothetical protein Y032_0457g1799 [Ancylostoma ceylanicum]
MRCSPTFHSEIAMWFALTSLVSVIALSYGVPECPGLGDHTMEQDVKDDLIPKVLRYSLDQEVASISSVYECNLEKIAGEILADPYKRIQFLPDIGIYPLLYYIEERGEDNVRLMTHAALQNWLKNLKNLHYFNFGCNYRFEHGMHNYLCLFRTEAE